MQFLRSTPLSRRLARWRRKRNHLVCVLLDRDPFLTRRNALKLANKRCGRMP
jgi:hypothetical protein